MIPALTPRRLDDDSIAMMARHTGRNGPATAPMMPRETSSTGNDGASPERIEHAEKMRRKASRKGLRSPFQSDQRAITYAPSAHMKERTELMSAVSVLLRCRSFAT